MGRVWSATGGHSFQKSCARFGGHLHAERTRKPIRAGIHTASCQSHYGNWTWWETTLWQSHCLITKPFWQIQGDTYCDRSLADSEYIGRTPPSGSKVPLTRCSWDHQRVQLVPNQDSVVRARWWWSNRDGRVSCFSLRLRNSEGVPAPT